MLVQCALVVQTDRNRMTPARIDWHLDNWAEWHARNRDDLGFASNPHIMAHDWHSKDVDQLLEPIEARCAEAVEAIVWELPAVQTCAVLNRHFDVVFKFAVESCLAVYEQARERIGCGLDVRGIY